MTGFREESEVYVQFNAIITRCYIQIEKHVFYCKENQDCMRNSVPYLNLKQFESASTGAEDSGNLVETGKTRKQIEERQLQIASFSDDYVSNLS